MHFIDMIGFDIKEGQMAAFQDWMRNNEDKLAAYLPEDAQHMGTFVSIYDSEKDSGQVFILTRMESYGTADKIAALGANEGYANLIAEAMSFMDQSSNAGGSRKLLKAITDATVWG